MARRATSDEALSLSASAGGAACARRRDGGVQFPGRPRLQSLTCVKLLPIARDERLQSFSVLKVLPASTFASSRPSFHGSTLRLVLGAQHRLRITGRRHQVSRAQRTPLLGETRKRGAELAKRLRSTG
jgi:hypothetical protein